MPKEIKHGNGFIFGENPSKNEQIDENDIIISISIQRHPLNIGTIHKLFLPYDKLYHLYMILFLSNGKVLKTEKGPLGVIISKKIKEQKNTSKIQIDNLNIPLKIAIDNTKKIMGNKYNPYNPITNNCQDYLISFLKSNNILTDDLKKFIKQKLIPF
jgi:hypothetical protein